MMLDLNDVLAISGAVGAPIGFAWRMLSSTMAGVRAEVQDAVDRLGRISDLAAAQIAINAALEHRVTRLERITDKM
jgi:hypothetical protein